jgi:hypothetical protein
MVVIQEDLNYKLECEGASFVLKIEKNLNFLFKILGLASAPNNIFTYIFEYNIKV